MDKPISPSWEGRSGGISSLGLQVALEGDTPPSPAWRFRSPLPQETEVKAEVVVETATISPVYLEEPMGHTTAYDDASSIYTLSEEEEEESVEDIPPELTSNSDLAFSRYFGPDPWIVRGQRIFWDHLCVPFLQGCVWGVVGHFWRWWWRDTRMIDGGTSHGTVSRRKMR